MRSSPNPPEELLFLDLETTGLGTDVEVWEIGAISWSGKIFHRQWVPDFAGAQLEALRITDMVRRLSTEGTSPELRDDHTNRQVPCAGDVARGQLAEFIREHYDDPAILAGASVHTDVNWLTHHGELDLDELHLSYRVHDVPTYVAGIMGMVKGEGLDAALDLFGIVRRAELEHTAMWDTWAARKVYGDAFMHRNGQLPDGFVDLSWREARP